MTDTSPVLFQGVPHLHVRESKTGKIKQSIPFEIPPKVRLTDLPKLEARLARLERGMLLSLRDHCVLDLSEAENSLRAIRRTIRRY